MGFIEDLAALVVTIRQRAEVVKTEEATKMSLIVPMLQTWGYDPFNPLEITPEYTADVGTKQKEKVDYAIMKDGEPIILIECKPAGACLDKHGSQLFRYFSVCPAKIGILTNGVEYRFFSDTEAENKMDLTPFLTVNLLNMKPGQDVQMSKFCREAFDMEELMPSIENLSKKRKIQEVIAESFDNPPDELMRYFIRQIHDGPISQKIMDRYSPMVREGIKTYFSEKVNAKLQSALNGEATNEECSCEENEDGIVTTEDEIAGFHIVQAIASEIIDPSRVVIRDNKSYLNILLDDTIRQQICRLYLNTSNWYISTYEQKEENKQPLQKLQDIYQHRDQILAAIRRYTEKENGQ